MEKFNSTIYHTVIIDLKEKRGASKNGYKKSQQNSFNKQHEITQCCRAELHYRENISRVAYVILSVTADNIETP